jgi:hypothetical protein
MSMSTDLFEAVYSGMTGAQASIRQGRSAEIRVLCAGLGTDRMDSEMGQFKSVDARVRLLASEVPDKVALEEGRKIELNAHGEGWREFRIGGRFVQDGVIRLTLEWPDE